MGKIKSLRIVLVNERRLEIEITLHSVDVHKIYMDLRQIVNSNSDIQKKRSKILITITPSRILGFIAYLRVVCQNLGLDVKHTRIKILPREI